MPWSSPSSLHTRCMRAPSWYPGGSIWRSANQTLDVDVTVLVDGHALTDVGQGSPISIRLSEQRSLLATLSPQATFFRRYRDTFGS